GEASGAAVFSLPGRRRHTRFSRNWSSDVCSSDLEALLVRPLEPGGKVGWGAWRRWLRRCQGGKHAGVGDVYTRCLRSLRHERVQIGRASCRDGAAMLVAVSSFLRLLVARKRGGQG